MAVPKKTWSFRIVARFGPGDLLRLGMSIAEDRKFKEASTEFEFDWIKRRVAFTASSRDLAVEAATILVGRVEKKCGVDQLLVGKPIDGENGRVTVPIGVALQTPEVFRELLVGGLYEAGLMGITPDPNDEGHFLIRPAGPAAALPWKDLVTGFPLPAYMYLEERVIEDAPRK